VHIFFETAMSTIAAKIPTTTTARQGCNIFNIFQQYQDS
jgi:hypothetical protein